MMFIVFALNIIIEQNVRTQWISSIQYRWELSVMTNHQISLCNTPRLSCHWTCCSNMRLALCRYTTIVVSVSITECKTAQNVYMRVVILFITDEQLQNKPRRFGRRFALVVAEVVGAWRPKSRIPFAQFCLRWQHCQTRIYFRPEINRIWSINLLENQKHTVRGTICMTSQSIDLLGFAVTS